MGTQDYRATYRVAMQEATSDLNEIYREVDELQARKEMIVQVLEAIQPFLTASEASYQDTRREPAAVAPPRQERAHEVLASVAAKAMPVSEPVAPAPFAPVPEVIVDPIQSRINRALGLAVA